MKYLRFMICAALICLSALAKAAEFSGKVIAVMDGDTLLVLRSGPPVKVRFAEIDAPETAQPFGMASQKSLAGMVMGKQVRVVSRAVDSYGRLVATIYVGEMNVNHEQVRRGMAWEYSRFHSNRELMALQREAQQAKRGLWAVDDAIEPSLWRKQHPSTFVAKLPAAAVPVDVKDTTETSEPANLGNDCNKKNCSEMSSCEEAMRYLAVCGQKSLDGDTDGKPCEKLCAVARTGTGGSQ